MADRSKRTLIIRGLGIGITIFLAIFIVSPLALTVVGWLPLDWNKLNSVGQSYTGVSALLSAAALIAIVATTRLQARQVELSQQQAVREMQFSLNQMVLQDRAFALVGTSEPIKTEGDYTRWRIRVYVAMVLRHLQFGYSLNVLSEDFVRVVLSNELFANEPARDFWNKYGGYVTYPTSTSETTSAFIRIVNEEFNKAVGTNKTTPA